MADNHLQMLKQTLKSLAIRLLDETKSFFKLKKKDLPFSTFFHTE
jgi:hypothetical protein